jgi:hypothetical protein
MELTIECQCGKLSGIARTDGLKGSRAVCLCDDCQSYAHYLGRAKEILDQYGGTDVFPMTPASLKITAGIENLKCMRLSPNGMYRWYAGCCNFPIGNTMNSDAIPYVGMVHNILEKKNNAEILTQEYGPIQEYIQGKFGIPPLPANTSQKVSLKFMFKVIRFILRAKLKKEATPSPFFDDQHRPLVAPIVITKEERAALTSRLHQKLPGSF